jgi:hypothetical protein
MEKIGRQEKIDFFARKFAIIERNKSVRKKYLAKITY